MKIQLKKLKIAHNLSEETLAYTAEIWIDGKLAFHARNDGHGGSDLYYKMGDITEAQVTAHAKATMQPQVFEGLTLEPDMELLIQTMIERMEADKKLNRMLKSKVVLLDADGKVYTFKCAPTPQNCDAVRQRNPKGQIINNASPELREQALIAMGVGA